jgi:hypothetical protein
VIGGSVDSILITADVVIVIEHNTTSQVEAIIWFRVNQETSFSSFHASFKNLIRSPIERPLLDPSQ